MITEQNAATRPLRIAIVGAGPAGIYAADALMKSDGHAGFDGVSIDLYERMPAPFGLIRYGVAPDHPRIKGIITALHKVLDKEQVRLLGNIDYGVDITLEDLRQFYDAVIFSTGANTDRALDVPGIDLDGSYGAADFVSWYDGHPDVPRTWPLEAEKVAVLGVGNVALDVARVLAKTGDELLPTEIPPNVHAGLQANKALEVHVFGRRGPAQAKFTPLELRELDHSPTIEVIVDPEDIDYDEGSETARRNSKQVDMICNTLEQWAIRDVGDRPHKLFLHFFENPSEILGENGKVVGLRTERTQLDGNGNVKPTGAYRDWGIQAVYRAVGYLSQPIPGLPFDEDSGTVPNTAGRIPGLPATYVTGWIKRGPVGLIGHTKGDANETIACLLDDASAFIPAANPDPASVIEFLERKGIPFTTWAGWYRLDAHERALGEPQGRERVKVVERGEMLAASEPGKKTGAAVPTARITKVLIANRGEIAVRVIRAAKDAGIASVAVYAEPDADAPFVKLADEAFALGGQTSAESYLVFDKILDAAAKSGADAIHPGYGFLSENADFAQAVIDAGLIWIGPSPQSIRDLGDKVTARHIAERGKAPMAAGTKDPVKNADEVVAFAKEYGVPVAIKAAFGGGGRGMKVAHTIEEIPELFESATREAIAAFGRGECFVEQYLDKARHVEAQVIADQHGNVVVAGTRDCSLQRRFQKLVEEAPAPFLSDSVRSKIHDSAKQICREAGYYGAGTVEYLVQGETVSFLEVNTRLQVEHPVTEETAGIDLVRQQFRIAEGHELTLTEDPAPRGHSFEFRINGEDAGRGFLPAPGPVVVYREPTGPGVRVDSGVVEGSVIGGQFDSMLAKLIVTGETRDQALQRAARALAEFQIEGLATVLPFHRHIVTNPAFVGDGEKFDVYTKWIENEWDNPIEPYTGAVTIEEDEEAPRQKVIVEVGGRRVEVSLPAQFSASTASTPIRKKPKPRKRGGAGATAASGDAVTAPMQGTVVKVAVEEGQSVEAGDLVVVLEAMKMENPVTAHKAGVITGLTVEPGAAITQGTILAEIN